MWAELASDKRRFVSDRIGKCSFFGECSSHSLYTGTQFLWLSVTLVWDVDNLGKKPLAKSKKKELREKKEKKTFLVWFFLAGGFYTHDWPYHVPKKRMRQLLRCSGDFANFWPFCIAFGIFSDFQHTNYSLPQTLVMRYVTLHYAT